MRQIKLFIISTIFSIIPGQLLRINVTDNSAINVTDILILTTNIYYLVHLGFIKKKLILPNFIFPFGLIFIISASASTLLSLNYFSPNEVFVAGLFLIRFIFYILFGIVIVNVVDKKDINKYLQFLIIAGFIFALFGFIQLKIYPDLSRLQVFGWDPHINRLVSTTLDPNFTGGLLIILIGICLSLFLYFKKNIYAMLSVFFSIALMLTFSRSTYIAFLISMFVVSAIKSPKIIIITILLFSASFLLIPNIRTRIIGALTIDKTAMSRVESWQNALVIIKANPVFGIGFNNYRYAQRDFGFFDYSNAEGGHSGAGSDSSLLLVLATTGTFGFIAFILWLASILVVISKNIRHDYLALALISSYIALIVHSQFVNSLFYPQILMPMILLISLKYVKDL